MKKLSVPLPSRFIYLLSPYPNTGGCAIAILQQIHPTLGAVPLYRYREYTNGFVFFGSGYIFFGLVDSFSSAYWILSSAESS
jgi:hypothetical protein